MEIKRVILQAGICVVGLGVLLGIGSCHSPAAASIYELASAKPNQVQAPVAAPAPASGLNNLVTVSLTSTEGATITYTLDGSDPAGGLTYVSPFTISVQNTLLRAKATRSGFPSSGELRGTYGFVGGVIYDPNGGAGSMGMDHPTVNVPTVLSNCTYSRPGYTFLGWAATPAGVVMYTDGSQVTLSTGQVLTLFAQWQANAGTIYFYPNDGTNSPVFKTQSLATGQTANLASIGSLGFTKSGYSFAGWAPSATGSVTYNDSQSVTMGATGLTLYAIWTANQYTVTFNPGSGGTVSPMTTNVTYGSTYGPLPTPALTGSVFLGWYTGANGSGIQVQSTTPVTITSPQTLYANWTTALTVTYAANNAVSSATGTAPLDPAALTSAGGYAANTAVTLQGVGGLTFTNNTLYGWMTQSDGSGVTYPVGSTFPITANTTLYPVWVPTGGTTRLAITVNGSDIILTGYTGSAPTNLQVPLGVTIIQQGPGFSGTSSLTSVTVSPSVKSITGAFQNCTGLTSVTFTSPSHLQTLGTMAFFGCINLQLTLPSSVTTLGYACLASTKTTGIVSIPSTITSIGDEPYGGCAISAFSVDPANPNYMSDANGILYTKNGTYLIQVPALLAASNLTVLPGVVTIGNNAFAGCQSLTGTVNLPSTLKTISFGVFQNCTGLTSINIPSSVTSLGSNEFYNCSSLASVTLGSPTPPTLVANSSAFFGNAASLKIHVPNGSLATYQAATGWSDYASNLVSP